MLFICSDALSNRDPKQLSIVSIRHQNHELGFCDVGRRLLKVLIVGIDQARLELILIVDLKFI